MEKLRTETISIRSPEDVVRVRQAVRTAAVAQTLSLIDQTKVVTAASELARNTLIYGGGGEAIVDQVIDGTKRGVRVTFADHGPGIPNITEALQDGFTTGGGLGLGLGGAKRLCNEFEIDSSPETGTRITIGRWR